MWVSFSTGYMRKGLFYDKYKAHFGKSDPDNILVIQAASNVFNSRLDEAARLRVFNASPAKYEAEWGGGWRNELSSFLDEQVIERAIDRDRPIELPPDLSKRPYVAFCDPSGLAHDAYTLCIAHKEGERVIIDLVRGVKPDPNSDPEEATKQFAKLIRSYWVYKVTGDRWGGEWVASAFKKFGVEYVQTDKRKSDIYQETVPIFMTGRILMPWIPHVISELRNLEVKTHSGGRDSIDHPDNGSDDYINSVCGACVLLTSSSPEQRYRDCFDAAWWKSKDEPEKLMSQADTNLQSIYQQ